MIEVRQTEAFRAWLEKLRDRRAAAKIAARLARLELGNFGDAEAVGEGVSELRIHYGPGYRAYFVQRGEVLVVMLCGGDKSSQDRDISRAKAMARELEM
ncbi:MAG: type II toxin-antitoxin system RelE/ParE family toxin [Phenylobacterium sp.]|uniref:type II toxin-antitoxin system RelE/ParE family toxin n=1 Tax=Phenylobacterium sp. TaxID=1871053 RepID=UPI0027261052|nr:type II toxin-antitoxin system RelE/ParE family toxin [Phenylobacterium sp.]MDO8410361.1 type II toxin-antitoxin system RelE/ParE family toxin [Phenylobacterium sp.]